MRYGRRNIEGGGRSPTTSTRTIAPCWLDGDFGQAWSYDGYGQYYYVQFYNTNNRYLNFERITNALQVKTGRGGVPECISGPPCVPYNIFADGGVTQDALDYLYSERYCLRHDDTAHGTPDFTADSANTASAYLGRPGAVAQRWLRDSDDAVELLAATKPQLSGLLSGFGGASVAIDESVNVDEYFAEMHVPLIQDKRGAADLSLDSGAAAGLFDER